MATKDGNLALKIKKQNEMRVVAMKRFRSSKPFKSVLRTA